MLGEQSAKQLRGEEISDVIARGNVRRGEKQSAEAYLTFRECQDVLDTDDDEIEVGRKVDSDGSGTYFLNGEQVRLKDIKDLFRDTGIGQDLYSSIGQGEVLKLVDSKPEDRREIIEEAAGIASYRHRRDLTRRRLKKTRTELEQVENELNEKQGRLSQLRGQAEKAERVRELQSELLQYRIEDAKRGYHEFKDSLEAKREKKSDLSENIEAAVEEKNEILQRKENLQSVRREIKSRKQRITNILGPYRKQRQRLREKQSEYRARVQSLRDQHERERTNRTQLVRQLDSERDALVNNYHERYRASLRESIYDARIEMLEDYREERTRRRDELSDRRETLRDRTLFHRTEVQDIKRRKETLEDDHRTVEKKLAELNDRLRATREQKRSVARDYGDHVDSLCHAETEIVKLTLKLSVRDREKEILDDIGQTLDNRRRTVRNKIERVEDEVQTLRHRIQSREDVPVGVRQLLNAAEEGTLEGVEGLLGDMIEVPDRYETALQVALGDHLHDVVLESFSAVPDILDYVREEELDAVTLRPRELYRGSNPGGTNGYTGHDGILERASDALDYDSGLENIIEVLLGKTLIVEDDSVIVEQLRDEGFPADGTRFVTLEGELIGDRPGMRFGNGNQESLLQRRNKISHLEERRDDLETDLTRLENDLEHVEETLKMRRRQIEQIRGSLQGLTEERRTNREATRKLGHEWDRQCQNLEERLEELAEVRYRSVNLGYSLTANRSIGRVVESIDDRKGNEIERMQDRISKVSAEIEELRSRQRDAEQRRSVARSRRQESNSRISEREDRIGQILDNIEDNERHVASIVEKQLDVTREITLASLRLKRIDSALSVLEGIERDVSDREEALREQFEEINSDLREYETREEKYRGKLNRVESELTNEEARFEDHREMIGDDLEIDPVASIENYTDHLDGDADVESLDRSELKDRIRSIKREVRNLKPVNMLAKKEADELEDEVQDIRSQFEDLQTSCDKLESLIERLNDKARNQFLEAFAEIQGYFEEFVAELFNGGDGSIELTDGPVLEAGVEIEIEPPGEQLRTMSALSGGEKTLVALAFLFALFERKSSPFCFLDEVDHPFDDENVNQFVQLLSRYRERTQFIVITHNKLTMQAADRLFGVTMEESGVTSIVPMELEEAESLREPQEV